VADREYWAMETTAACMLMNNHSQVIKEIIRYVRNNRLTYLSDAKLYSLASICILNKRNCVPGGLIEAGCALGGSSIVLAAAKEKTQSLRLYDVFSMIPPPTNKDGKDVHDRYKVIACGESRGIGGDLYYGYVDGLLEKVEKTFDECGYPIRSNNIQLIKGMIQDTMHVDDAVSLAHIDVDWYESVFTCLKRITPMLSVGGTIILDDYFCWSGCRDAVNEYFLDKNSNFSFRESARTMVITRERR
jgi:asparagine synthase (glutamine-hydrolysing)